MLSLLLLGTLAATPLQDVIEPSPAERQWLAFRDGEALDAVILDVKDDKVVARIPSLGIERAAIPLSRLSRASALHLLHEREDLGSADALVRLASIAEESGMFLQAVSDLERAKEIDPTREGALADWLERLRHDGSKAALDRAERLEELGETSAARARYRALERTWEETAAARQATARLEELGNGAPDDGAGASEPPRMEVLEDERLERVEQLLERGRKSYRRSLQTADDLGDAEDLLLDAVDDQKRALERLQDVREDEELAETSEEQLRDEQKPLARRIRHLEDRAKLHLLDTRVALGHHYIAAGDTLEAHRYAALAQSVEPEAPKVLNLLESVAAASARDRRGRRR